MTIRKDGERVDLVAIQILPICPCSFDGKSAFCRILVRVQTGAACRRVRKRLGVAGPVMKESAYKVPYLKRQRSRLITGHILVRGQGEPPCLQSRLALGMTAATIQRPAKQLRLRCGLGERRSGSLLEFQPLASCNLLGGYALCIIPVISSVGGHSNPLTVKLPKGGVAG